MKAKKVLVTVAGAALVASVALSMTACGNGKSLDKTTLDISAYATEYTGSTNSYGDLKVTSALSVTNSEIEDMLGSDMLILNNGTNSNPSYSVFSFTYGKTILSGLNAIPEYKSYSDFNLLVTSVRNSNSNTYNNKYYTLDGKEVLSISDYSASYSNNYMDYISDSYVTGCYVKDETETSKIYTLIFERYDSKGDITETVKYFREVLDEETDITSYEVLSLSDIKFYGSEYNKDGNYNGLVSDIYSQSSTKPVEGDIAEYKVSRVGDIRTFSKNGEVTGSVSLKNGEFLGYVGNYMYYYIMTPVQSNAKNGYNYIYNGYTEVKAKYELYRYDIVNDSNKKLNYNLAITDITALYNYETKSYDAAIISGYEMVDGIAYNGSNEFTYIVDKDLKLAYDMHGVSISSSNIYSVGESNFIIGNNIYDNDMNVVNSASASNIYAEYGLIRFSAGNGYGFTDYNGKIVIEPKYSSVKGGGIVFYGGAAYVTELQADGNQKAAFLKTDGSVVYVDSLASGNDKSIDVGYGYYVITTSTSQDYYTYSGTLLKQFSSGVKITNTTFENYTYITESVSGTTNYYKLG